MWLWERCCAVASITMKVVYTHCIICPITSPSSPYGLQMWLAQHLTLATWNDMFSPFWIWLCLELFLITVCSKIMFLSVISLLPSVICIVINIVVIFCFVGYFSDLCYNFFWFYWLWLCAFLNINTWFTVAGNWFTICDLNYFLRFIFTEAASRIKSWVHCIVEPMLQWRICITYHVVYTVGWYCTLHVGWKSKRLCSDTGTRTLVSCVKGKYANHLHHIGSTCVLRHIIIYNIY